MRLAKRECCTYVKTQHACLLQKAGRFGDGIASELETERTLGDLGIASYTHDQTATDMQLVYVG